MTRQQRQLYNRLLTIERKIADVDVDFASSDFTDENCQVDIAQASAAIQNAISNLLKSVNE